MSNARRLFSRASGFTLCTIAASVASVGYVLLAIRLPPYSMFKALFPVAWIVTIFSVFVVPTMALVSALGAGVLRRTDPKGFRLYVASLALVTVWGCILLLAQGLGLE